MKNVFHTLAILFVNIAISQTHQISKHNENISDRVVVDSKSDYKLVIVLPQEKEIGIERSTKFYWSLDKQKRRTTNGEQ